MVGKACEAIPVCHQIMKCSDSSCCSGWRTKLLDVLPPRFLLVPFPLHQMKNGVIVSEPKDHIKMDLKKNPFGSQHIRLSLKMSPEAAISMKTSVLLFMIHPFIDNQLNISYKLFWLCP